MIRAPKTKSLPLRSLVALLVVAAPIAGSDARADGPTLAFLDVLVRPYGDNAALDMLGGGAHQGRWAASAQGGWAWSAVRAQYGVASRLALVAQVETALGARWQPAAGVGVRLVDARHLRLSAEALLGWLVQTGEVTARGPTAELRLRLAVPIGRAVAWVVLGTRHALLPDRTTIERAAGTEIAWSLRHEWTPWIGAGVGVVITRGFGLSVGIDYGWIGAPDSIVIPGFHLALHFGGGGR